MKNTSKQRSSKAKVLMIEVTKTGASMAGVMAAPQTPPKPVGLLKSASYYHHLVDSLVGIHPIGDTNPRACTPSSPNNLEWLPEK